MPTALEILNEPVTGSFIVLTNMINTLFKQKWLEQYAPAIETQ